MRGPFSRFEISDFNAERASGGSWHVRPFEVELSGPGAIFVEIEETKPN